MDIKQKENIAFEGTEFIIEWYFDKNHKSVALDYFDSMDNDDQIQLLRLFELMGNVGEIKQI